MKKIILALFVVMVSGCTQMQARKIGNAFDRISEVSRAVCTSAELFETGAPVTEACEKALPYLNGAEYQIIADVLDCTQLDAGRVECVAGVEGWGELARKIDGKL